MFSCLAVQTVQSKMFSPGVKKKVLLRIIITANEGGTGLKESDVAAGVPAIAMDSFL